MLENNPMGSRRRRRFYHRIGVVPIPGDEVHDFIEVPTSFFTDDPEPVKFYIDDKPHTSVVSISALLSRLLDIVDKMIALAEAEERDKDNEEEKSESQDEKEGKNQVTSEKGTEAETKNEAKVEAENDVENESEAESEAE